MFRRGEIMCCKDASRLLVLVLAIFAGCIETAERPGEPVTASVPMDRVVCKRVLEAVHILFIAGQSALKHTIRQTEILAILDGWV